jgi:flavin reductase (DIM6/NTAB) family NADH-FMN oxidoreductase RutF
MNTQLKPINVKALSGNVFKLLDDDWMLISAGTKDSFNSMTASWGTFGILWNKPVIVAFVRPQRYTFEFMNKNECFTLSFLGENYREALKVFGSYSGRNTDKVLKSGLNPVLTDKGNVTYKEASLVFECRKLYCDDIKPGSFIDQSLIQHIYPQSDFHRFYIGEVLNCMASEQFIVDKGLHHSSLEDNSPDF